MHGIGEGIAQIFWAMIFLIVCGFSACSYFAVESVDNEDIIPALGNSIENIEAFKRDCEKSLPRDQECVMVFDFVPVKKEKSE